MRINENTDEYHMLNNKKLRVSRINKIISYIILYYYIIYNSIYILYMLDIILTRLFIFV
jgi:hypothetical protein